MAEFPIFYIHLISTAKWMYLLELVENIGKIIICICCCCVMSVWVQRILYGQTAKPHSAWAPLQQRISRTFIRSKHSTGTFVLFALLEFNGSRKDLRIGEMNAQFSITYLFNYSIMTLDYVYGVQLCIRERIHLSHRQNWIFWIWDGPTKAARETQKK